MIKGLIIDLDGTLLDSHPFLYQVYLEFLKERGVEGTQEEFESLHIPIREVVRTLQEKYHLTGDNLFEAYQEKLNQSPPLRKGAQEFLHFAKLNQLKMVLSTTASDSYARNCLKNAGIESYFSAVLTEQTDKYVPALNALGLSADEVIHFDDRLLDPDWEQLQKRIEAENYQTLYSGPTLKVKIIPTPEGVRLSDAQKLSADLIWNEEIQAKPHLFNGKILHFIGMKGDILQGVFVEYKHFLAQLRGLDLGIRGVCISGITTYQNKILIAKRSTNVSQYQGAFELLPAGSFDNSSLKWEKQFIQEMQEEASIPPEQIEKISFLAVIHDVRESIVEIVARIELNKPDFSPTKETELIKWYDPEDSKEAFVPFSYYLLSRF